MSIPDNSSPAVRPAGQARLSMRRMIFGALALLGLASGALVGFPWLSCHYQARQSWEEAQQALANEELPGALAHLEAALAVWPNSGTGHFQLAQVCRRLHDLPAARQHLEQASRLGYPKHEIDLEQVLLLAQEGDLRTSESTLHALLQTGQLQQPLIFEALIEGYLATRDLRNADRWASRWIDRQPESWRAHLLRAQARELGVRLEEAIADYEFVAAAQPHDPALHFKIGDLLRRQNRYTEALPHLQAARAARPEDALFVASLARCLRALGRSADAVQVLAGWEAHPERAPATILMLRGRLAMDLQNQTEALRWLRLAEAAGPRDEETLTALSSVLRELGQTDDAERYAARARDVHRKLKQVDALLRSLRNDPQSVGVRSELGRLLLQLGQDAEGKRWLASALEIDPDHSPTHLVLADYYAEEGNVELARSHRLAAEGKLRARVEN